MRALIRDGSIALGVTTICLLFLLGPIISPQHNFFYHLSASPLVGLIPLVANFLLAWLLLTLVLSSARKSAWLGRIVWLVLVLLLPGIFAKNCAQLMGWAMPHWMTLGVFVLPAVIFVAAIPVSHSSFRHVFLHAQRAYGGLLCFVAIAGIVILGQVFWASWAARALNAPNPLHSARSTSASVPSHPRVVWIILDELSYRQVYEQRFPGLQLPEFDHLAAQSAVFAHAIPAGAHTEVAVNALLTGSLIDKIRVSGEGQLRELHDPASGAWRHFDPRDNVFQDALTRGESPGVAGWFNPYCRVMPQVLDRCFWVYRASFGAGIDSDRSLGQNLTAPARRILSYAQFSVQRLTTREHRMSPIALRDAEMHVEDYQDLCAESDNLLRDASMDFLFLHVPVPHPGGIFDRKQMRIAIDRTSYVDNLVLADQYLAHVHALLEQRGEWDSSLVLVMGDHSWRTQYFHRGSDWTKEDELASYGGQFDDRPAYIVKLPHQREGLRIDSPFATIRTRRLIAAIMENRIPGADDLQAWAQQTEIVPQKP